MTRATWIHEPRGGYGYQIPVPCIVLRRGPRKVKIAVLRANLDRINLRVVDAARVRPGNPADAALHESIERFLGNPDV